MNLQFQVYVPFKIIIQGLLFSKMKIQKHEILNFLGTFRSLPGKSLRILIAYEKKKEKEIWDFEK